MAPNAPTGESTTQQNAQADERSSGLTMGKYECRLLPHGAYTLVPTTFATLAWIASLSQDGCDYARLSGKNVEALTGQDIFPYLEVGMSAYRIPKWDPADESWSINYHDECESYDDFKVGAAFELARIFAFLALVFGGGGALFLWFSSCFVFGPSTWRWAGYEVALASFFQILAFSWFGSDLCSGDSSCTMHYGSNSDIIALMFWFCSAVLIFRKYPTPTPKTSGNQNANGGTTEDGLELPIAGDANVVVESNDSNPALQRDAPEIKLDVKAAEEDAEII